MGHSVKEERRKPLDWLWELVFPSKCPFCGCVVERDMAVCARCGQELPWLTGPAALKRVELTGGCVSVFHYQDQVRQSIHSYKFGGRSGRARAYGTLMARTVAQQELDFDLISWPPLSRRRRRQRGYDQAELLARRVGVLLEVPVVSTLKKSHRPAQSSLEDGARRRANLRGAYSVPQPAQVHGRHILLIDDVVTTGSTLSECARVLRLAGAEGVVCATLARAGD